MMDRQEDVILSLSPLLLNDLAVVEHFATRVAVMYLGRSVNWHQTSTLFSSPKHPYTQALIIRLFLIRQQYRPNRFD